MPEGGRARAGVEMIASQRTESVICAEAWLFLLEHTLDLLRRRGSRRLQNKMSSKYACISNPHCLSHLAQRRSVTKRAGHGLG